MGPWKVRLRGTVVGPGLRVFVNDGGKRKSTFFCLFLLFWVFLVWVWLVYLFFEGADVRELALALESGTGMPMLVQG